MVKKLALMVMAGAMLAPVTLAAQSLPTAGAAHGDTGGDVVYQKETVYDFDGDDVEGNLVKPDGTNITGEQRGKTSSLINIRGDFIPEMLKSVESL